jgi:hypothetical protein
VCMVPGPAASCVCPELCFLLLAVSSELFVNDILLLLPSPLIVHHAHSACLPPQRQGELLLYRAASTVC